MLCRHVRQPSVGFHGLLKTLWISSELRRHIKNIQDTCTPGQYLPSRWANDEEGAGINGKSVFRNLGPGLPVLLENLAQELSIDWATLSARVACPETIAPMICALIAPKLQHLSIVLNCWKFTCMRQSCRHRCLLLEQTDEPIFGNKSEGKHMFHDLRPLQLVWRLACRSRRA
jgi:hypothetical protein